MDWYSRYVLAWRLSNTLDADFCVEALEEALKKGRPDIFNTDQGSQFTGKAFTGLLEKHGIKISMDGKGSYRDNLFIERLWRTVKYEEIKNRLENLIRPVSPLAPCRPGDQIRTAVPRFLLLMMCFF